MHRYLINLLSIFLLSILFTQLTGCATYKLRAATTLEEENPMKKIALVGAARIVRPRLQGRESVLTLTHSKKAIEVGLAKLTRAFEKKGYNVVYSQPVGVGYKWPANKENWVYTFKINKDGSEPEDQKYQILDGSPAYQYPASEDNDKYRAAVRQEFERMYEHDFQGQVRGYTPTLTSLNIIQQETSGDTICFVNVWGRQYSGNRKARAILFGGSNTDDLMVTHVVCSQAASGKVMWQRWALDWENPVKPDDKHYARLLEFFPEANNKLNIKDCKLSDIDKSIYACIDRDVDFK